VTEFRKNSGQTRSDR